MGASRAAVEPDVHDEPSTADEPRPDGLLRAFGLLRDHPVQLTVVALLTVAGVGVGLLTPWLFGRAVGAIQEENESNIIWLGGAVIVAGVVAAGLGAARQFFSGRLAVDLEFALRNQVYGHLLELDQAFYQKRQVGQVVSLIMVTSGPIRQFLAVSLPKIATDALLFLFAGLAMTVIDPRLAVLSLWPIPIVVFLVVRMGRVITPAMKDFQEAIADVTASGEETLREILSVHVLAAQDTRAEHFAQRTDHWYSVGRTVIRAGAVYDAAIENLPNFAWAGLFLLGGYSVIDGTLALSTFVTFLGYVGMMLSPISNLGSRLWTTQSASASAQRVFEILDRQPLVVERDDAAVLSGDSRTVQMRGVTKRFGESVNAVDAVEFDIAAATSVAIVGRSGSGKSAVLGMIQRVHDPDVGAVLVDGTPIDEVQLASLRSTVASVGSAPHLFNSSVMDNLTYGAPDATTDDVSTITRALGIHDDITDLVDGYSTIVGATGVQVPVALAQGISIARALARRPGILLLDDVTAPLAPANEKAIVDGLRVLTRDITVVAVAARPALLGLVDRIVLLDRGSVSAHGTFGELAANSSEFRELLTAWRLDRGIRPTDGAAE